MDKLTIEHIAPYLAYGVKVYIWDGGYEKPLEYPTIIGLYGDSITQTSYRFKSIHCGDDIFKRPEMSVGLSITKPILRPLSDLFEWVDYNDGHGLVKIGYKYGIVKDDHGDYCEVLDAGQCESPKAYIPLNCYNFWLFKYHFDVFGLIDRGLAIDINTLKGGQS